MATGLAGKWMRFAKTATYFHVTRCRSNIRAKWIETTNAESPTLSGSVFEEYISGVFGGDVDIDVVYQISDALFAAFTPGTSYAVTFYPDKTNAANLTGTLCVETWEQTSEINGAQMVKVTGKFTGGFTSTNM